MPGFLVVLVTDLFLYSLLHTGERMSKKDGFSTNVNERYLNTQKELYPLPSLNLTPNILYSLAGRAKLAMQYIFMNDYLEYIIDDKVDFVCI